jgi:hypothetical protein
MKKRKHQTDSSEPDTKKFKKNHNEALSMKKILFFDIIIEIFKYLSFNDKYSFACVNKFLWECYKEENVKTKVWTSIFSHMDYKDYSMIKTINSHVYEAFEKMISKRRKISPQKDLFYNSSSGKLNIYHIESNFKRKDGNYIKIKHNSGKIINRKVKYEKNSPYIKDGWQKLQKGDIQLLEKINMKRCCICKKYDYLSSGYVLSSKCGCNLMIDSTFKPDIYHYHFDICIDCLKNKY